MQDITGDAVNDKVDGGTRLLRKSSASTLYDKYLKGQASANDIYSQMKTMAHNSKTHLNDYIFSVKPTA